MDRRKVLKLTAGAVIAGGAGMATLATAFKHQPLPTAPRKKIELDKTDTSWKYTHLDPSTTSQVAYENYNIGSCMYGVVSSIVSQLGEIIGEPYLSFPVQMMKYGHGGIGGEGTICGTLNGAAAILGLLIDNKKVRDALTADLFSWYENSALPKFTPPDAIFNFAPPTSVAKSSLCHVSTARWGKQAGYRIDSDQRKERCRRLTADVASHTVEMLNAYFDNEFMATHHQNEAATNCVACHGSEGKLGNTSGKMNCTSCHEQSLAHKVFGDVHYKMMDKR
jgi:hypothetical protein